MLNIKRFLNLGNKNIVKLGRWNLQYDEKIINRIVFLANEDNCGCCSEKLFEDEYYYPFIC